MKIIDRYLLREFFVNYAIALMVMIGLYLVVDLFFNFDEFARDTTGNADALRRITDTLWRIVDYYSYNMLVYFAQLSGVITVVAACCTLARLHRANELTALLASGTSLYRVAWPIVIAGLMLNGLWVVDQEWLIPRSAHKLARPHSDIEGRTVNPVYFVPDRNHALLSAGKFMPSSHDIQDLIVMHRDAAGNLTEITRADAARWDPERKVWSLLARGFKETVGRDADVGLNRMPVTTYASALTPEDIMIQQASAWTSFLSLRELASVQRQFPGDSTFVKVKHARLTTPFVNMILLLLAIPFFLTRERISVVVMGSRCLVLCGACFLVSFVGQNVDFSAVTTNVALPVWLPVLTFGPVAVLMVDGIRT